MATKIRLQRFGRKGYAFYQVVVADSRDPRDGKFIERIGSYNPNTNPATIDLNFERALYWLQVGAKPTDTARMVLSRDGVLLKNHILGGVKKGAFDEATAEKKFEEWLERKKLSLQKVKDDERTKKRTSDKTLLEAEKEINKAKAAVLAQKRADIAAEKAAKAKEEADARAAADAAAAAELAALTAPEKEAEEVVEAVVTEPVATEETSIKEDVPTEEPVAAPAEEKPVETAAAE
ncbi:MAG: 30S ribosomal protein S16 [Tannerella sp.]|jgi:small subunit ribosomal protein S16|nr:30S ribosomal protein S16 [Tannerella sp.]